jgi:hypothetical protein
MCPPRCYRCRLQLESKASGIDVRVRGFRLVRRQTRRFGERLSEDCVATPHTSPRRSSPGDLRQERARWTKDGRLPHSGQVAASRGNPVSIPTYSVEVIENLAGHPEIVRAWREALRC